MDEREELSKEELSIFDLLARDLLHGFPNRQRVGCTPSAVIKGIAHRQLRLAEIHQWLDHVSSCSPCYREFTELQTEADMTP